MGIKYEKAYDVEKKATEIVEILEWSHIFLEHVAFIRSFGSKSRGTIARCHALGKAMQIGMNRTKGFYLIEVISERFDKMSEEEKVKTIIHELMHIPKTFGGGFVHHNMVHERSVKKVFDNFIKLKMEKRWEGKKDNLDAEKIVGDSEKKIWDIKKEDVKVKKVRRWF